MGLHDIGDDSAGYARFQKGDNAYIKISQLEPDRDQYQGEEYFQLAMEFDAVNESDPEEQGTVPGWFSSKVTVRDSEEHTSNLAKMLQAAGVLRDVLSDVLEDSDAVAKVLNGEARWEAETESENEAVGKAVASALQGKVLRAGTKHNSTGEYSIVKSVYGEVGEDPFAGEDVEEDGREALFDDEGDTSQ